MAAAVFVAGGTVRGSGVTAGIIPCGVCSGVEGNCCCGGGEVATGVVIDDSAVEVGRRVLGSKGSRGHC